MGEVCVAGLEGRALEPAFPPAPPPQAILGWPIVWRLHLCKSCSKETQADAQSPWCPLCATLQEDVPLFSRVCQVSPVRHWGSDGGQGRPWYCLYSLQSNGIKPERKWINSHE